MGGHVGLEVLARRPDLFSSFTGLQSAIRPREARPFAERLARAFQTHAAPALQIITSDRDTYRTANQRLYDALSNLGVEAELEMDRGWHTRQWMQRVGSRAMLAWQDRVLRYTLDSRTATLISTTAERCPCASTPSPRG
jgi:pimeloyl-ACP methyl ester carboxylesterase